MSGLDIAPLSVPEHAHEAIESRIAESEARSRQFTEESIKNIHDRLNDLSERLDRAADQTAQQAPVVVNTPPPVEHVNQAAEETAANVEAAAEPVVAAEPVAAVVKEEPKQQKKERRHGLRHRR